MTGPGRLLEGRPDLVLSHAIVHRQVTAASPRDDFVAEPGLPERWVLRRQLAGVLEQARRQLRQHPDVAEVPE